MGSGGPTGDLGRGLCFDRARGRERQTNHATARTPQNRGAASRNGCRCQALVDGIKYQCSGDDAFHAQTMFDEKELSGSLRNMLRDTVKSVLQHTVYDSAIASGGRGSGRERNAVVNLPVRQALAPRPPKIRKGPARGLFSGRGQFTRAGGSPRTHRNPPRLRLGLFGDAQGQYAVFQLRVNVRCIKFAAQGEAAPVARH